MRVLLTGATGKLGRELLPRLSQAGHEVVALTRRTFPPDVPARAVEGDLATGEGLEDATKGCDAIIHAATAGFGDRYSLRWAIFHRSAVDVAGTRRLLEAAARAGIAHVVFTSIVGIDRVPLYPRIYRYFKHKLAAERLVRESSVPSTTLRFTQLYPLVDQVLEWQFGIRGPVLVPETLGQPIDPGDAAEMVIRHVDQPAGDMVEFGGPQVLTAGEIVQAWKACRRIQRKEHFYRVPGPIGRAFIDGALTCPDRSVGRITWSEWLSRKYK